MPPIDASVDSATVPSFVPGTSPSTSAAASASQSPSTDCEDTLNLRLPEEFFALCAETDHHAAASNEVTPDPDAAVPDPAADGEVDPIARQNPTEDAEGTSWVAFDAVPTPDATPTSDGPPNPNISPRTYTPPTADLLDRIDGWGPTDTPAGPFHLLPVHIERDLP